MASTGSVNHVVFGEGDVSARGQPPDRRVVLRRSGQRCQRAAADLRAPGSGHRRSSASWTSSAATTRRVKYDGVFSPKLLVEASYSHARNQIVETPSVNDWFTQDFRVTPTLVTGGIGFYEAGNDGKNDQFQVKATSIVGCPPAPLRRELRASWNTTRSTSAPDRRSRRRMASRRRPARRSTSCRRSRRSGRSIA